MSTYEGDAYQTESGLWSWFINEDGEQISQQSGYENREDAWNAMYDEMSRYLQDGGCTY